MHLPHMQSRRTRGFYTGLAAALTLFALSVLWLLSASQSDRQVSDLVQLQALQVNERSSDAVPYLLSAVADAESDSAFSVHGCTFVPSTYCADLQARLVNYSASASGTLSVPPVGVFGTVSSFACSDLLPAPPGFSNAYSVNGTLNVTLSGFPVTARRLVDFSDIVLVNASSPSNPFRAIVNRTQSGVVGDVSVHCG